MPDLFDEIASPPEEDAANETRAEDESQVLAEASVGDETQEVIKETAETGDDSDDEGSEAIEADETVDETVDADSDGEPEAPVTSELDAKIAQEAPKPAAKVPEAPKQVDVVEQDPYEFNKCLISIGIGLMPDDENPDGRRVTLAIRNHRDEPIFSMCRLSDLMPLPDPIQQLIERLKEDLPARSEKAVEKKRKAEAARSKAKATVGKTVSPVKVVKKVEKPKPTSLNLFDIFDVPAK